MIGIAQTKVALLASMQLAIEVIKVAKDGVQISDVGTLIASEPVKMSLGALLAAVKEIPAELKDITLAEGWELGMAAASKVPEIIEALKK